MFFSYLKYNVTRVSTDSAFVEFVAGFVAIAAVGVVAFVVVVVASVAVVMQETQHFQWVPCLAILDINRAQVARCVFLAQGKIGLARELELVWRESAVVVALALRCCQRTAVVAAPRVGSTRGLVDRVEVVVFVVVVEADVAI